MFSRKMVFGLYYARNLARAEPVALATGHDLSFKFRIFKSSVNIGFQPVSRNEEFRLVFD